MMQTRNIGIVLNQGSSFSLTISIFGPGQVPTNLTGYSFLGQIRQSTDPTVINPVAEFVFTILDQSVEDNIGKVQWELGLTAIDAIITSVASPLVINRLTTPFLYDVKMLDTLGNVSRIIQGIAEVSPQATQEAFT